MKKTLLLCLVCLSLQWFTFGDVLCYTERVTEASSFNIYTGWNDPNNPIAWNHSVPAGLLDSVVRVGLYIEAYDVDYPADTEQDRVRINGHDLGILEGLNDTWITVEKDIPISYIQEGINQFQVSVDELHLGWKVTIRASEIRFYCATPNPDFAMGITPTHQSITSGDQAEYQIDITPLNGFDSPVTLSVEGLPADLTAQISPNPVIPGSPALLKIAHTHVAPAGTYPLLIKGNGGGLTHTTEGKLKISVPTNFACSLTKSFSKNKAWPGESLTMAIELMNLTPYEATDVYLSDILSPHLQYLEDDSGLTPFWQGSKISWKIPLLEGNQTLRITTRLKIKQATPPGIITNQAQLAHASLGDKIYSNTVELLIPSAEINLRKTVSQTTAKPGESLSYKLILHNLGETPLTQVTVKDVLAEELKFISQMGPFEFEQKQSELMWTGSIPPHQELTIEIETEIKEDCAAGATIPNRGELDAKELKETKFSNTVFTLIQSEPVSDQQVSFKHRSEIPQSDIGKIIRLRFTIENRSDSPLLSPVIDNSLPEGFSYIRNTSLLNLSKLGDPQGSRRLIWQLPLIQPRERVVLRYQVMIGSNAKRGKNLSRGRLNFNDNTGQSTQKEASAFINVSADSLIFYSGVGGSVFLDKEGDRMFTSGDIPMPGVEVRLSTGEKAVTNSDGRFRFEQLYPGEYAVGINIATLDSKYKLASQSPLIAVLFDGFTEEIDFALTFSNLDLKDNGRIQGRVFFDKNKNKAYDAGEPLLKKFIAILNDQQRTAGSNGKFVFTHLPIKTHRITIQYEQRSYHQNINLKQRKLEVDIPIPYRAVRINLRGEE